MAESDHWHPGAAYLYVLHLDGPALAWEYLRRHPGYRRDWQRRRRHPATAQRWGLRLLENPVLDARDAHPAWFPDHDGVVQVYPDADPPPDAQRFAFWRIPGRKHLIHDGRRLVLATHWAGYCIRLALAPGLEDCMAYAYAVRAAPDPCARCRALVGELDKLMVVTVPVALAYRLGCDRSHSRSAASIRVCHPVLVARKRSSTSGESRIVMCSLRTSAGGRPARRIRAN